MLALASARTVHPLATRLIRAEATMIQPALGQDLSEQFALYAAPEKQTVPLDPGQVPHALGVMKARGDVHRDGDWHRSVHIWLVQENRLRKHTCEFSTQSAP